MATELLLQLVISYFNRNFYLSHVAPHSALTAMPQVAGFVLEPRLQPWRERDCFVPQHSSCPAGSSSWLFTNTGCTGFFISHFYFTGSGLRCSRRLKECCRASAERAVAGIVLGFLLLCLCGTPRDCERKTELLGKNCSNGLGMGTCRV